MADVKNRLGECRDARSVRPLKRTCFYASIPMEQAHEPCVSTSSSQPYCVAIGPRQTFTLNLIDVHIAVHDGIDGEGTDASHAEFFDNILAVADDRGETDVELVGYFLIDVALCNQ